MKPCTKVWRQRDETAENIQETEYSMTGPTSVCRRVVEYWAREKATGRGGSILCGRRLHLGPVGYGSPLQDFKQRYNKICVSEANFLEDYLTWTRMKGRKCVRVQGNAKTVRCDNALRQRNGGTVGGGGIPH